MNLFALTLLFVSVYCAILPENKQQSPNEFALPDIQKICTNNNANVDQCIRQAVSDAISQLYSQLPPLRVSLVDPLVADGLRRAANSNSPTKIYSNSHVTEVNIYFPKIVIEGTYQADMKYQGSNRITSGPFNVAMSRPEPSQMPVVHSVLGDTLASTGNFLLNLTPNILQNRPELNNAQRPEDSSNPNFVGNKPKPKIIVGTPKDQANEQFDFSQAENKPPIKHSTGGNFGSTQLSEQQKPNIRSVTESKPEILLIKPSSTQDSTLRPAIETKPTILEVLNPTPVIKNVPTHLVDSNSDSQKLPENQPSLEALPEPIVPSVTMPLLPEDSSALNPGVETKPALDEAHPELSSDSQTLSQNLGVASPLPKFVDASPTTPDQDTDEQPIIQSKPTSDAIAESDTQMNGKPKGDTSFTSVSESSLSMNIPEDNPIVTQTSDSSTPMDDMTISSVDFALPSFVQACDEDDPDFGRCLREAIWAVIPSLYNEYQPFQIRRLDPLNIERTHIDYDSGYFQVAANFEDLVTKGLNEALYRDIRLKISDGIVRADVSLFMPKINLETRFNAEFENNGFMIPASGPFNVTMTDIDMTQKWTGRFITKNQHKYLNVDRIEMIPAIGSVNFNLENDFSGQPRNDIAVNFLNQNWADMYKELIRSTRSTWEPIMIVAVNEFLGRIPFDLLIKPKAQPTIGSTTMSSVEPSPIIVESTIEPVLPFMPSNPSEGSVIPMETTSVDNAPESPDKAPESNPAGESTPETNEAPIQTIIVNEPVTMLQVPTVEEFIKLGDKKPCKENDPSFDQCIQESVSAVIPGLFIAIKPFQSTQIDPLNALTAKIEYNNDILKSVITVENLATHGLSQAEYRDAQFKIDGDNVRVNFKIFLPQLILDGIYNADIQYTYLELHPIVTGPFNITMYDVEMTQNWNGHFVTKNGHRYVEIDEIEMSPEVGRVDFHEAGDFPDEEAKETAIIFLNSNWGDIYKLLVPATRDFWEPPMKNALNQFLSGLPFDLLITSEDQQATVSDSDPQTPIGESVTSLQGPITSSGLPIQLPLLGPAENKPKEENPSVVPPALSTDKPVSTEEFILPDYVNPCYEDDLDYDQCVRIAVYQILPQLYEQFRPFQKPKLDPLIIENAHIDYYDPRDVQVAIDFEKMNASGMNAVDLRDIVIRIYGDRARADVKLFYPKIILNGTYNVQIQYKGLRFSASGPVVINMTDIDMAQVWKGDFVNKNGHRYLKLDSIEMTPEIGSASFELNQVFDPSRKEIAVNFLNQNWGMLYKAFVTGTSSFWEPVMITYLNEFLENLPFDALTSSKNAARPIQVPSLIGSTTISEINLQGTEKDTVQSTINPTEETIVQQSEMESIMTSTQGAMGQSTSSDEIIDSITTEKVSEDKKPLQDNNSILAGEPEIQMLDGNPQLILLGERKLCKENDPSFDQCIQESVSSIIPELFTAIKPFESAEIDPLNIPNAKIEYNNDIIQSDISVENLSTHGMSQAEYRDIQFKIDGDNVRVDFKVFCPQLNLDGIFKANIQVKFLELHPIGPFNVSMYDVEITQNWKGHFIMKSGHRYVEIDEIEMSPEVGRVDFRMGADFLDEGARAIAIVFLNQNWGGMYKLLVPATRTVWEPPMKNALNQFLSGLPFDLLFTSEDQQATINNSGPQIASSTGELLSPPASVDPVTSLQEPSTSSESPIPPPVPAPVDNKPKEEPTTVAPPAPPTEKPISTEEFIIPDFIQPCYEADADFNACVRDAVWRTVQIYFTENNPFRAVQLNPLYTETAEIEYNPGDSKKAITFEQFSTYGFNITELRDIRMRVYSESIQTEVNLVFPRLFIEGHYKAEIEYNGFKLTPMGPFNISMDNVQVIQIWKGRFINRNQHKYLQINEIKMTPQVGTVNARIEGVFDDQRGPIVEAYLNSNWDRMYAILVPASISSWGPIMINAINKFLDRLPFDFIRLQNDNQ